MTRTERFGFLRMSGGRYEIRGALPVSAAVELQQYERLIQDVARALFLRDNPDRRRTSGGFKELGTLFLTNVEDGSAIPVLERVRTEEDALFEGRDYAEEARRLINQAFDKVASADALLPAFPTNCLASLSKLGKTMQEDERFEFGDVPGEDPVAFLDTQVRQSLQSLASLDKIEVELSLIGFVTGVQSDPQGFDFRSAAGAARHSGTYSDVSVFDELSSVLGYQNLAPLTHLTVIAERTEDGSIRSILDVLGVEAALPAEWHDRLSAIANAPQAWRGPGVPPPSQQAVESAERILLGLLDKSTARPGIFAYMEGGVQLEWEAWDDSVEVSIANDGQVNIQRLRNEANDTDLLLDGKDIETIVRSVGGMLND